MKCSKRYLLWALSLIFIATMSVSCIRMGGETKEKVEETSSRENKKEKKSKNKKKKEEPIKDNKKEVSNKPHILLEEVYEYNYDEDLGGYLYKIKSVHYKLKEEEKEFEPLIEAFDKYNKAVDEEFKEIREMFLEYSQQDSEYPEDMRYSETESYVMRADEGIVSILNYVKEDYGYRTPMYIRNSYNFDTSTGEVLEFKDVVKDTEAFFDLVDEIAANDYSELDITKPSEYVSGLNGGDFTGFPWTISPEGVTVYFDTYVLGSYTDGPQVITVYFDKNEDLFDQKYINSEDDYVYPILHDNMTLYLDVDDDGERDMVYVNDIYDEYEEERYPRGSKVISGEDALEFEGFGSESYIVKKDGKYYMYHFMNEESEVVILYKVDLDNLNKNEDRYTIAQLTTMYPDWEYNGGLENYTLVRETLTDPSSFIMGRDIFTLGTTFGEREWEIGENAYPKAKNERYKMTMDEVLYTKSDIPCEEIDSEGNIKSTTVIPEDSYILIIFGDGEEYVDVKVINKKYVEKNQIGDMDFTYFILKDKSVLDYDGDCYRIRVDSDENGWNQTVDGIDIYELFDGIAYVG